MRVVLVGPYPVDPTRFGGGVETSFFNLVQGLSTLDDLDTHVVTFVRGERRASRVDTGPVPVHYLPGRERLNNLTFHLSDRHVLRRALDRLAPDVVHAQDALGYGYVCLKVARREPVVVSIHGIVRETRKQLSKRRDRVHVLLAGVGLERYCVRHARYLVQPTSYPQEYFGSEIRGRIVDVGNGIADGFFAAEPAPELGRVLFAGGIADGKRLLDLVEAVAELRSTVASVGLRVAGPASDRSYAARVVARVAELRLENEVTLLGSLSAAQMIEEYRKASLVVLPSAQETSPMVIGEAMAVGVPVVATRVGGVPYLVEEGKTGFLVEVGDIGALATRMSQLLLDEQMRAAFGASARTRALERFRCADVARRVRDVYQQALQEV